MDVDLDTARDLWAAKYGYEWRTFTYVNDTPEIATTNPFWCGLMYKLVDTSCLDVDYATGKMRLKEWK
jgi:hypothetical protein